MFAFRLKSDERHLEIFFISCEHIPNPVGKFPPKKQANMGIYKKN